MGVTCVDESGEATTLPRGHAHQRGQDRTGRHGLGRGGYDGDNGGLYRITPDYGLRRHHRYHVAELITITESV